MNRHERRRHTAIYGEHPHNCKTPHRWNGWWNQAKRVKRVRTADNTIALVSHTPARKAA